MIEQEVINTSLTLSMLLLQGISGVGMHVIDKLILSAVLVCNLFLLYQYIFIHGAVVNQIHLERSALTLLFVDSNDDDALVATYTDEFVDGADTSAGQLTQEDHALDVVVLQEADVGPHLGDRPHVHHHNVLHFWEPVLVKPTTEPRHL